MPYTVFPLFGIFHDAEGVARCLCGDLECKSSPGKHPAYPYGSLEAGQQIRGPHGHGIATGWKSGIFVLDTDGPEADARFRALGPIPDTFTVKTPSGGRHYYFVWPGFPVRNSVGEFDWSAEVDGFDADTGKKRSTKIDVRGDGGFVVAPGSPHKSGRPYEVEINVAPVAAPAFLLEWAGLRGRDVSTDLEGSWVPIPVDVNTDLGKKRVELGRDACATMDASIAGQNGSSRLWQLAIRLVRDLELPLEVASDLVLEVFNPRCEPPWSPQEVWHKLTDARDKSDKMPGNVTDINLRERLKPEVVTTPTGDTYECTLKSIGNLATSTPTFGKVVEILSGSVTSWDGVLCYDEFRDRIVARAPKDGGPRPIRLEAEKTCFVDRDVSAIRKWFECLAGFKVSKENAWDAAVAVARDNSFHPVKDYLASLPPEPTATLDRAAHIFFGSTDPLDAVLMRKFMVGAVRRILRPGEKMDTMLVLVGAQGAGKSTFVPALFGEEFTSEDLADIRTKDAMIGLAGKWAIEVAELDKLLRTDPETVKAFVTRCVDPYRAPYERVSTDHPRQCVYVGTSNKDDFLRDPTGERRYWIIDVRKSGGVDLEAVRAWRDRMWSAAYALAKRDKYEVPHWLTNEEAASLAVRAAMFKGEDGWTTAIATFCTGRNTVKTEDIFKALGGTPDRLDRKSINRITDALRELGCVRTIEAEGRVRVRCWQVPAHLATAEVNEHEAYRRAGEALINTMKNGMQ